LCLWCRQQATEGMSHRCTLAAYTLALGNAVFAKLGVRLDKQHASPALEQEFAIHELTAAALDAEGGLPDLTVCGFRLRQVLRVSNSHSWRIERFNIPRNFTSLARDRRLDALEAAIKAPLKLITIRAKVQAMALLTAASVPDKYLQPKYYYHKQTGHLVYDNSKNIFSNLVDLDATRRLTPSVGEKNVEKDLKGLEAARRTVLKNPTFTTEDASGVDSTGVVAQLGFTISMYEDSSNKVLIFHDLAPDVHQTNTQRMYKNWILEEYESRLMFLWTVQSQQKVTTEIIERTEKRKNQEWAEKEKELRCAFNAADFKIMDSETETKLVQSMNAKEDSTINDLLWRYIKKAVRMILPEDRIDDKTVLLTGAGFGGTVAAGVSMWLDKSDKKQYETYPIASPGWECVFRRTTILADIDVTNNPKQIHSYVHVLDPFGSAMDRFTGEICYYGGVNLSSSPVHDYCQQIIGYTGPELLGLSIPTPDASVIDARQALEACAYFTHSPWYAAKLFASEAVLHWNGKTDGGCSDQMPLPINDTIKRCPSDEIQTKIKALCAEVEQPETSLPLGRMALLGGSILGTVSCCFVVAYGLVRHYRLHKESGTRGTGTFFQLSKTVFGKRNALDTVAPSDSPKPFQRNRKAAHAEKDKLINALPASPKASIASDPVSGLRAGTGHQWAAHGSSDALDMARNGHLWPAYGSSDALDRAGNSHLWPALGSSDSLDKSDGAKMVMPAE